MQRQIDRQACRETGKDAPYQMEEHRDRKTEHQMHRNSNLDKRGSRMDKQKTGVKEISTERKRRKDIQRGVEINRRGIETS